MPIKTRPPIGRRQIAWLGLVPPEEARLVFEARGFSLKACTDEELEDPSVLAGLSAVVLSQQADKPLRIVEELRRHACRLLNFDCQVVLRPGSKELSNKPTIILNAVKELNLWTAGFSSEEAEDLGWQKTERSTPPSPHVFFCRLEYSWDVVANGVTENPPGPPPNIGLKPKVHKETNGKRSHIQLDDEAILLLQRAFCDCVDVHLVAMADGRSGVDVYRVHAEFASGLHGRWQQPYFAKIGGHRKIFKEYKAYEECVAPYIPFHLGPSLFKERCCLGATQGIIVGDFVDQSESLRECACDGRAAGAIAGLFDRTLQGWYQDAKRVSIPLSEGLVNLFPRKIAPTRLTRARELGAGRDLESLRELFLRCRSGSVFVGPIHGDLHAGNVMVRVSDSVVIDFYRHKHDLPLIYDAACLEASLLVEGFSNDDRDIDEWMASLATLYQGPLFEGGNSNPNPKDPSCWFHSCLRQIRRYARQWECGEGGECQYAGVLGFALLEKATKDPDAKKPESDRRAAAYVFAEKVLSTFENQVTAVKAL